MRRGDNDRAFAKLVGVNVRHRLLRHGAQQTVEHKTPRAPFGVAEARGQPRIVGADRAGADRDRREVAAPAVAVDARLFPGDPFRIAGACRHFAVECHPGLRREKRPAGRHPVIENHVQVGALGREHTRSHRDIDGAQHLVALARVRGIRIRRTDDHAGQPRFDDGIGAGTGSAGRTTRLKGHVECGPGLRLPAEGSQRIDLSMRLTVFRVEALRDNLAVFDDQCANKRVGMGRAPTPSRQIERAPHETFMFGRIHRTTAATNGLLSFSSPTVVRGPWPGSTTVSSGSE